MTDPSLPLERPDPKPFEPAATKPASGCQKPLLIGCGTLALLLGIGAIVFVLKAKDVLAFAMGRLQAEVTSHLPEQFPPEDKSKLEQGFECAMTKIRQGDLEPEKLQALQHELTTVAQAASSRTLQAAEILGLQKSLDDFCDSNRPPVPAEPTGSAAPEG